MSICGKSDYNYNTSVNMILHNRSQVEVGLDLIPDHVQRYINIVLTQTLLPSVALFGVITNLLTIFLLAKGGVKECVSMCVLSLAFSDFGVSVSILGFSLLSIAASSDAYLYVDPSSVTVLVAWILVYFCDVTMFHTSFLSLERCLCVVFPFHFKTMITFKSAAAVLVGIYILTAACLMPAFVSTGLTERFDPTYNRTRILLWTAENRDFLIGLLNMYHIIGISFLNLFTVILCTAGMIAGLRRSSKFARVNSATDSLTSRKSKTVVKMVTVLALIYIACTCVRSLGTLPRLLVDDVAPYKQHHNVYQTLVAVYVFAGSVNSSVNIFVYYHYKPMFKEHFWELLGGQKAGKVDVLSRKE